MLSESPGLERTMNLRLADVPVNIILLACNGHSSNGGLSNIFILHNGKSEGRWFQS